MYFLTDEEVIHLTGKTRWLSQTRALALMGIPFQRRPDGKPIVARSAIAGNDEKKANAPNWNAA